MGILNNLPWGQLTVVKCDKSISIPDLKLLITIYESSLEQYLYKLMTYNILKISK